MEEDKLLIREEIYKGNILHVYKDTIDLGDGLTAQREVVEHQGGVGIALEDSDGKYFIVRQWRYARQEETLEFPAGKKEEGEDSLTTAKREVQEETGYLGKDWKYLGKIYPTPAYDTEVIDLYYAKVDSFIGQHLDEDESVEVLRYDLQELTEEILKGNIPDAKTIAMVMYLKELKQRDQL